MLSRLVLGYLVALPAIVALVVSCIDPRQAYTLVVKMSAVASGPIQVFYDTGAGFNEKQSVMTPLQASGPSREYELPLAPGSYRSLRIDPGTSAGIYMIEYVGIRTCGGGRTHSVIPLADLVPAYHLAAIRRSRDHLVLEAPPGSNDPQLLYTPAAPLSLVPHNGRPGSLAGRILALWVFGILVVCGAEQLLRPFGSVLWRAWERLSAVAQTYPRAGLLIIALLSTAAATYPILVLGRSFVSPSNGPTPLLYDRPPYGAGRAGFGFRRRAGQRRRGVGVAGRSAFSDST